jgi:hypothetical protein
LTAAARVGWWRRLRTLSPRATLVAGFAVFLVYAFPGYMSTDSVEQLFEARIRHFSDGHPPLMAVEWLVLDQIVAGPILMLLLQGALFLGGLYHLFRRLVTPHAAARLAVGVLLFPPVMTTMAVIWKDSQMAACLVAGTAALLDPRVRVRVGGLGLLVAACAIRYNALVAAIPLAVILFEGRRPLRWWRRVAMFFAACVVAAGAAFGVSRAIAVEHVKLTPAFSDVVAVLACTHERDDADLREVLRGTPLVVHHHIQDQARLLHELHGTWRIAASDDRLFNSPSTPAEWSALERAWKELVLGDFGAYLRCRWQDYTRIIGLTDEGIRAPVWNLFLEDIGQMEPIEHDASWSRFQEWVGYKLYWLSSNTPLFRAWVYAVIALLLLPLCCRDRVTLALFASGLLYEASFFPVGAEPDYRYSHWMITSVCIACVFLFVQRWRARVS